MSLTHGAPRIDELTNRHARTYCFSPYVFVVFRSYARFRSAVMFCTTPSTVLCARDASTEIDRVLTKYRTAERRVANIDKKLVPENTYLVARQFGRTAFLYVWWIDAD